MHAARVSRATVLSTVSALWVLPPALLAAQTAVPALPKQDFSGNSSRKVLKISSFERVVVQIDGEEVAYRLLGVAKGDGSKTRRESSDRFVANMLREEAVYITHAVSVAGDGPGEQRAMLFRAPDGLCVNLEIVRQGYGKVAEREFAHRDVFEHYERVARKAKKGLWGRPEPRALREPARGDTRRDSTQNEETRRASDSKRDERSAGVFVTKTGKKYHLDGCSSLRTSRIPLSTAEAKTKGYTPCARCKPPE